MKTILSLFAIIAIQSLCAQDIISFPYTTSFEGIEGNLHQNFPEGWSSEDLNVSQFGNQGWQIIKNSDFSQNAHTDSTAVHMFSHSSETNDVWLYTPSIQMEVSENIVYALSFWYKANVFGNTTEKLKIHAANEATAEAMTLTEPIWSQNSISSEVYQQALIEFVPESSGIYYFGFHYYSDEFQYLLFIDDIIINEDLIEAVSEFERDYAPVLSYLSNTALRLDLAKPLEQAVQVMVYDFKGSMLARQSISRGEQQFNLPLSVSRQNLVIQIIDEQGRQLYSIRSVSLR